MKRISVAAACLLLVACFAWAPVSRAVANETGTTTSNEVAKQHGRGDGAGSNDSSDSGLSVWDKLKQGAADLYNDVKQGAADLYNDVKQGAADLYNGIVNGAKTLYNGAKVVLTTIGGGIAVAWNWLTTTWPGRILLTVVVVVACVVVALLAAPVTIAGLVISAGFIATCAWGAALGFASYTVVQGLITYLTGRDSWSVGGFFLSGLLGAVTGAIGFGFSKAIAALGILQRLAPLGYVGAWFARFATGFFTGAIGLIMHGDAMNLQAWFVLAGLSAIAAFLSTPTEYSTTSQWSGHGSKLIQFQKLDAVPTATDIAKKVINKESDVITDVAEGVSR